MAHTAAGLLLLPVICSFKPALCLIDLQEQVEFKGFQPSKDVKTMQVCWLFYSEFTTTQPCHLIVFTHLDPIVSNWYFAMKQSYECCII